MHSNAQLMLSKLAVTMPYGNGAFGVSTHKNNLFLPMKTIQFTYLLT